MAMNLSAMVEATRLTRAGRLNEAMAVIGAALAKQPPGGANAETVDPAPAPSASTPTHARLAAPSAPRLGSSVAAPSPGQPATILKDNPLTAFLRKRGAGVFKQPTLHGGLGAKPLAVPDGATFSEHTHTGAAGIRHYKLYIPSGHRDAPLPLIVMLHGCTQSPDDFAAGTRMNEIAEELGFLIAYPAQPQSANASKCWNWFNAHDQRRGTGEPSLIAGITADIVRDQGADPTRIYVAGLSAGGAAAVTMGATYPELYAAVGVHSGLACGAAKDVPSAFSAMRQGGTGTPLLDSLPTIVFHGDRDTTVSPINSDQVIAQALASSTLERVVSRGRAAGGADYTRTVFSEPGGHARLEQWVLHGAGHAWSGGSPAGSYTDPRGPDASREMVRFFVDHRKHSPL